jgi:hypothetical protein
MFISFYFPVIILLHTLPKIWYCQKVASIANYFMAVVLFYDIIIFVLFQTRNVGQLIKLQFFYKKNKNIFVVKSRDFVSADYFYLWKDKKREQLHRRIGKQKEILSSPVNICG